MDKSQRNRITTAIKHHNQQYLNSITSADYYSNFEQKFNNLNCKTRSLIRKEHGSENSIAELSHLGRLVAGFMEDMKQKKAPAFDFLEYKHVLNEYLIHYLDAKRKTNYGRQCASYGETLFVLYLDFREVIGGINDGRPIQVDGTAQCISQKVTLPSGATQCDLTCATAGVTITPSTIYSSQVVEICIPVSATPKQTIITENNNNLTLENNTQVISELYQPQVINVVATFTYATGTQTSSLTIIQI